MANYEPKNGTAAIVADTKERQMNATAAAASRNKRRLQAKDKPQVVNPVVCIEEGGALLFGQVSVDNYPVY